MSMQLAPLDCMINRPPVRVLSVDDSPFFRKILSDILGHRTDIDLVGCANDPYEARDSLLALKVDVLTLDLEMPRMGGLTFLKLIMERKPMPVIILSSVAPSGSPDAVQAMMAGAYTVIEKPANLAATTGFGEKLVRDIKTAAAAPLRRHRPALLNPCVSTRPMPTSIFDPRHIIALGASTGGTQALEEVLTALPPKLPGIVIVQHIPKGFSTSFAARLDRVCALEVREAKDGDVIRPGLALLAPGDQHMEIHWIRDHYRVRLSAGTFVEHQRPSVDVLFNSLANCAGSYTIAALMTGMGRDGASGMKVLHDLHAYTIAQNAETSVVYGMARKAVELNAVDSILPLTSIAGAIVKALQTHKTRMQVASNAQ
ncbi:MAG TPA: chemotaxis response regulator protein-glutamate methylesterase [Candidatus Methylacidiphilales bacterium]